ncbi:MAG: hypothetical protein NVS1B14_03990 [Vulcanimicrobiaceae bacterium]
MRPIMPDDAALSTFDVSVRAAVYDAAIHSGAIPRISALAATLGADAIEVRAALQKLADAHMLVLQPGSAEILMANPFSAVPTPFVTRVGARWWYGNCIWDAMGIAAMLHAEATIECSCGCCGVALDLQVPKDCIDSDGRVAHFGIPAARWWDNIVFN